MTEEDATVPGRKQLLVPLIATILVGLVVTLLYWFFACPCERTPGGWLLGEVHDEPVEDWSFANDVTLCQLQVYAGIRPHSLNLNCMSTPNGELYVSCSDCEGKYWSRQVSTDSPARLRLDGTVYPVVINRVMDDATLDRAWAARANKLRQLAGEDSGTPPAIPPRAEGWWSFHLESAT